MSQNFILNKKNPQTVYFQMEITGLNAHSWWWLCFYFG